MKQNSRKDISKKYLELTQKLMPLRTACAGGRIPILGQYETEADERGKDNDDDNDDNDEDGGAKQKGKKVQKYSEYAYTSKLDKLIEELESIRDNDPTSKSLVFSQFTSTLNWLQQVRAGSLQCPALIGKIQILRFLLCRNF